MYVNIDSLKEILLEDLEKTTSELKMTLSIKGNIEKTRDYEMRTGVKSVIMDASSSLKSISEQVDALNIRLSKISTALAEIGHPVYVDFERNGKGQVFIKSE